MHRRVCTRLAPTLTAWKSFYLRRSNHLGPGLVAGRALLHLSLIYARFGTLIGLNYDYYVNPVHSEFAHRYGMFSPRRIPYSFADYFSLRLPSLERRPPFVAADRHFYNHPSLFSNRDSEVY